MLLDEDYVRVMRNIDRMRVYALETILPARPSIKQNHDRRCVRVAQGACSSARLNASVTSSRAPAGRAGDPDVAPHLKRRVRGHSLTMSLMGCSTVALRRQT